MNDINEFVIQKLQEAGIGFKTIAGILGLRDEFAVVKKIREKSFTSQELLKLGEYLDVDIKELKTEGTSEDELVSVLNKYEKQRRNILKKCDGSISKLDPVERGAVIALSQIIGDIENVLKVKIMDNTLMK